MYKVKFTKISNNHERLRDDIIMGECVELPVEGKPFMMFAKPRDVGDYRRVNTSTIVKLDCIGNVYTVKTLSGSVYKIETEIHLPTTIGKLIYIEGCRSVSDIMSSLELKHFGLYDRDDAIKISKDELSYIQ